MGLHNFHDTLTRGVVNGGAGGQNCFPSPEGFTFAWGTSTPSAVADYAPGCMFLNTSTGVVSRNTGTVTSCTFTSLAGASLTLDQAFDNGKIINGANSAGNAFQVGDGTDAILMHTEAAGDVQITTNGTSNLTIAPDGGAIVATGTLALSGDFAIATNKFTVAASDGDTLVAGTLDVTLDFAIATNKFTVAAATGDTVVAGTLDSTGNFDVNSNFTVAAASGDTVVGGTLDVTGNFDVNSNFDVVAASGDTTVGGDLVVSGTGTSTFAGDMTVAGTATIGSVLMNSLTAVTTNSDLTLNGNGSGAVVISNSGTGGISLADDTTLAGSKTLVCTGVDGSDIITLTAGDVVISDGSVLITDTDNATSLGLTNNTITSGVLVSILSTSLTTGTALSITADAVTSGTLLYLDTTAATFTGLYIQCWDGAASDFSVGLYGATIIAGNATGTDALTITNGDITQGSGDLTLTDGDLILSAGVASITGDAATSALTIVPAADGAAVDINLPGTANLAGGYVDIDGSTGSGPVMEVTMSGTYTGDYISLLMANAVGAKALDIVGAGTRTVALVHLTDTPEGAGAHTIDIDVTPAALTLQVIDIDVAGTDDADIFCIDFAAAYTGDAISITLDNTVTASGIVVSGTNTPQGAVNILAATGIPDANGRILEVTTSGNASAANVGLCARFLETGNAQATSYAVQIDSTNNEALNVLVGRCHFVESISVLASPVLGVASNYIQAGGGNNAITAALQDDTATNVALSDGLRLVIDLATFTLQAGGNTLNYNGGGAVAIMMSSNPAANLTTAYAAGGVIEVIYSTTDSVWLDLSQ